jgi:hypothetical protein
MQPCDEDDEKDDKIFFSFSQVMEHRWNEIHKGKLRYWGKILSQCHFVTTNPTWTDQGSNPGGGRRLTS